MYQEQKGYHLSFLDQQPHIRNYGRHVTIFPFPDIYHADAAIDALRNGLAVMLQHFPQLAGHLNVTDSKSGRLNLMYPEHMQPPDEAERIFNPSFVVATHPDYSYNTLSRTHLDPAHFPADIFCPSLLRHHPGLDDGDGYATGSTSFSKAVPLPVMAAQATFIPSGLVLSLWMHHSVADGAGARRMYELWSEGVRGKHTEGADSCENMIRRLLQTDRDLGVLHETGSLFDQPPAALELDDLARTSLPEPWSDSTSSATNVAALRDTPYRVGAKLFRFSCPTIVDLSATLSILTQSHISPFTAMAALLWAHINQARSQSPTSGGNKTSTMAVVVDLRTRLGPPFTDPDYLGNCVLSTKPTCPLSPAHQLFSGLSVADIAQLAQLISDSLQSFSPFAVESRLATLMSSTASPPMIDCQSLTFANGSDVYVTDWRRMGMDNEWNIPGTSSSRPVAMRRACWKGEGGIVVLPRRDEGEDVWEAMVSLEEGELQRLENGLIEGRWLIDDGEVETGERARL